jgi:hypothetical protein
MEFVLVVESRSPEMNARSRREFVDITVITHGHMMNVAGAEKFGAK